MNWLPDGAKRIDDEWMPEGAVSVGSDPVLIDDTWEYVLTGGALRNVLSPVEQPAYDRVMQNTDNPAEFEAALASSLYLASIVREDPAYVFDMQKEIGKLLFGQEVTPRSVLQYAIRNEDIIDQYVDTWNQIVTDPEVEDLGWAAEVKNALARGGLRTVAAPVPGTAGFLARKVARSPLTRMIYPRQAQATDLPDLEKTGQSLQDIAKLISDEAEMDSLRPRKGGVMGFVTNTMFETVPMMAAAAVGGYVLGPAGAWAVAAAAEGDVQAQEALKFLADRDDLTDEQKQRIADTQRLVVGSINGVVEQLQVGGVLKIAKGMDRGTLKLLKAAVSQRSLTKLGRTVGLIGLGEIATANSEGWEEVIQELVSIGAARVYGDRIEITEDANRILQSYAGGFTAGMGLGMAGGALQGGVSWSQLRQEERQQLRLMAARKKMENVQRRRFSTWVDQVNAVEGALKDFQQIKAEQETQNAEAVRGVQGQAQEAGTVGQGGQEAGGPVVEQPAPEQPGRTPQEVAPAEGGERRTVYHATKAASFTEFDLERAGTATDEGLMGRGIYVSTDPQIARNTPQATTVQATIPADLKLLDVFYPKWGSDKTALVNDAIGTQGLTGQALTDAVRAAGYGGVRLDYSPVGYRQQEIVVYDPSLLTVQPPSQAPSETAPQTSEAGPVSEDEIATWKEAPENMGQWKIASEVPNTDSISASLDEGSYTERGVRLVPISDWKLSARDTYVAADDIRRVEELKSELQQSDTIEPAIVVYDDEDVYILEGLHRASALFELGEPYLPALVIDARTKAPNAAESAGPVSELSRLESRAEELAGKAFLSESEEAELERIEERIDRQLETVAPADNVDQAIDRVKDSAARLGITLDDVVIEDTEQELTWEQDEDILKQGGLTKKEYDDAIARGDKFIKAGDYRSENTPSGQKRAYITLFRGHTPETVYHEYAHAIEEIGGIPGWVGSKEQHAEYIARLLIEGRWQEVEDLVRGVGSVSEEMNLPSVRKVGADKPLIVPEDIHEGRKKPSPTTRQFGMTAAEREIFGRDPALSRLVRWSQLHQKPIGYKKGVADTNQKMRAALDALRTKQKIYDRNRVDLANIVATVVPKEYQGRYLRRVAEARTARDAEKVLEAIEQWVEEKEKRDAIRGFKKFKSQVKGMARRGEAKYGMLPMDLAKQVEDLLESFDPEKMTESTEKTLKARNEWFERVTRVLQNGYENIEAEHDADARDLVIIPQRYIDQLTRLRQTKAEDMTVEQIDWIQQQVQNLIDLHMEKGRHKKNIWYERVQKNVNDAINQLAETEPSEESLGLLSKAKKIAIQKQANLRTLSRMIGGKYTAAIEKILWDDLQQGMFKRHAKFVEFVNAWKDEIAAAGLNWKKIGKKLSKVVTVKIGGKDTEMTLDDLLMLYTYTQADGTFKRILTTESLILRTLKPRAGGLWYTQKEVTRKAPSISELREIANLIPEPLRKLVDIHFKVNREHQAPALNEVSRRTENTDLARDNKHASIHRVLYSKGGGGRQASEATRAIDMQGRFLPRSGGTDPIRIRGFSKEIMDGLQADAAFYGMSEAMNQAWALVNSRKFEKRMRDRGMKSLYQDIRTMLSRIQIYSTDQSILDELAGQAFTNVGKSILSGRLSSGLIQVASLPAAKAVIQRKFVKTHIPKAGDIKALMDKYPALFMRWKGKQFDYAMGAIGAQHAFETMLFDREPITDIGLAHFTKMDQFAIFSIYQSAMEQAAETGEDGEALFWRAMETQPNWDTMYKSVLTTDTSALSRGISMFMSARSAQENILFQAASDRAKGRINTEEMLHRMEPIAEAIFWVSVIKTLTKRLVGTFGLTALVGLGLREPPDEEEVKEMLKNDSLKIGQDTIFNAVGLNAWGGAITGAAYGAISSMRFGRTEIDKGRLRTGNLVVDLYSDVGVALGDGILFVGYAGGGLLGLESARNADGSLKVYDSGRAFFQDTARWTTYYLGLPFEGPMSDFYYPIKRAYEQEYTR